MPWCLRCLLSGQKARLVLKLWLSSRRTENKYLIAGKSSESKISVYSTPECVSTVEVSIKYGKPIISVCTIARGTMKIAQEKFPSLKDSWLVLQRPKTAWFHRTEPHPFVKRQQAYRSEYQNTAVRLWPPYTAPEPQVKQAGSQWIWCLSSRW